MTDLLINQLVLKCVCGNADEEPVKVLAERVDVDARDYIGVVHRDATLDPLGTCDWALGLADLGDRLRWARADV